MLKRVFVFSLFLFATHGIFGKDNNHVSATTKTVSVTQIAPVLRIDGIDAVEETLLCRGASNGNIIGTVQGGTSPYTVKLLDSAGVQVGTDITVNASGGQFNFSSLPAGDYTIDITDASGTKATKNTKIEQPATSVTINGLTSSSLKCNGNTNGTITGTAAGGTPPYTVALQDIAGNSIGTNKNLNSAPYTFTYSNLGANAYNLTVTDFRACALRINTQVTQPPVLQLTANNVALDCHGDTGTISAKVEGGTPPYTLFLSAPTVAGFTNVTKNLTNSGDTFDFSGLAAGTYQLAIKDNNSDSASQKTGCNLTKTIRITQPAAALSMRGVAAVEATLPCHGTSNGQIEGTVRGGTPPYTAKLFDSAGAQVGRTINVRFDGGFFWFRSLAAESYTIKITDKNGCNVTENTKIEQPSSVVSITEITGVEFRLQCNGDSNGVISGKVQGGTPPYEVTLINTFDRSRSRKNVASSGDTFTFNGLTASTYIVKLRDKNFCAIDAVTKVSAPNPLAITMNGSNFRCAGDSSAKVSGKVEGGTPPYNLTFIKQGDATFSHIETVTTDGGLYELTGLYSGIYNVVVTDANGNTNGCRATATANVVAPPTLTAALIVAYNVSCAGSKNATIYLKVKGGAKIRGPGGAILSPYYNFTINGSAVTPVAALAADVYGFGNLEVDPTGAIKQKDFTIVVTDACGTSQTVTTRITQPSPLGLIEFTGVEFALSCNGDRNGTIKAKITGGTPPYKVYLFGGGREDRDVPNENGEFIFNNLRARNYTLMVVDKKNCAITRNTKITEPPLLEIKNILAVEERLKCNRDSNGNITGEIHGGTPPYNLTLSYDSDPFVTERRTVNTDGGTFDFNGMPADSYTLSVTDAKRCFKTKSTSITEPNALQVSIDKSVLNCRGGMDGIIKGTITGGTAPYTITMDGTARTQNTSGAFEFKNLGVGTYSFSITDANGNAGGCSSKGLTVVNNPPSALAFDFLSKQEVSCYLGNDGYITMRVTGGKLPYKFKINGAAINPIKTGDTYKFPDLDVGAGVYQKKYTLYVEDDCGVNSTIVKNITQPRRLKITEIDPVEETLGCFGDTNGNIIGKIQGGVAPYALFLFGTPHKKNVLKDNDTFDFANLSAGTYRVVVLDSKGCQFGVTTRIDQPAEIKIRPDVVHPACTSTPNTGSIDLSIRGGVGKYTLSWNDLGTARSRSNLSPGVYTVTVKDENDCQKIKNITIKEPPEFKIEHTLSDVSCFGKKDGRIKLKIVGGGKPFNIRWEDAAGAGVERNDLDKGTYRVFVTDLGSCTISKVFNVLEAKKLTVTATIQNDFDDCNLGLGSVVLKVSGGTPPFKYKWNNGSITKDLAAVAANNYAVTVTDSKGCSFRGVYTVKKIKALEATLTKKIQRSCKKETINQENILKVSGGTPPYVVKWSGGDVDKNDKFRMVTDRPGTYKVKVRDAMGCEKQITFEITILKPQKVDFEEESIALKKLKIHAINDPIAFIPSILDKRINYLWDLGDGSFSKEMQPEHTYAMVGTYNVSLKVTFPNGCSYLYKKVLKLNKGYKIRVPNAFTPNKDGINDFFKPLYEGIKYVKMHIYDISGRLVYAEEGATIKGWDGGAMGNGLYIAHIEASVFYGRVIVINSRVTLLK